MAEFINIASYIRRDGVPMEGRNHTYTLANNADLVVEVTKHGDLSKLEFYVRYHNEKRQLTGWWATYGNGRGTASNARAAYEKVSAKVIADLQSGKVNHLTKV